MVSVGSPSLETNASLDNVYIIDGESFIPATCMYVLRITIDDEAMMDYMRCKER